VKRERSADLQERFDSLTPREQEVISLAVSGMLNNRLPVNSDCGKYREGSSQPGNGEDERAIFCHLVRMIENLRLCEEAS